MTMLEGVKYVMVPLVELENLMKRVEEVAAMKDRLLLIEKINLLSNGDTLRIKDAARICNMSERTIERRIETGEIQSLKDIGRRLIPIDSFIDWYTKNFK